MSISVGSLKETIKKTNKLFVFVCSCLKHEEDMDASIKRSVQSPQFKPKWLNVKYIFFP